MVDDAFISYRRKPSGMLSLLIQEKLKNEYERDCYVDSTRTDSTQVQFPDRLMQAIEESPSFICLLGDSTLESEWVLKEIRKAHELQKFCIPVFQESYKAPQNSEEAVQYLLNFDGVHVFDIKNIFVDESIKMIAELLPQLSEPPAQEESTPVQDNRSEMLDKVQQYWIDGVLKKSLGKRGSLPVPLKFSSQAVLRHRDYDDYKFPENTLNIHQIFRIMQHELLILGAPGSGKTILLLQLAEKLIADARADEKLPIPVIFNLSSWAVKQNPLRNWLIDELSIKYQIPKRVGKKWVENEKLLLLLDGFDEVVEEHRAECREAINTFREEYRGVDMAICSRIAEYEDLTTKLDLQGAITLQPLSDEQIQDYLSNGVYLTLRGIMATDKTLQDIAKIPFLLNTMAYVYQDVTSVMLALAKGEKRIDHLFKEYVEKRIREDNPNSQYTPKQTRQYLKWLAKNMIHDGQTVFTIEGIQPTAVVGTSRMIYRFFEISLLGFVIGGVEGYLLWSFLVEIVGVQYFSFLSNLLWLPFLVFASGFVYALFHHPIYGMFTGLLIGIVAGISTPVGIPIGLLVGTVIGFLLSLVYIRLNALIGGGMQIRPVERLRFSLKRSMVSIIFIDAVILILFALLGFFSGLLQMQVYSISVDILDFAFLGISIGNIYLIPLSIVGAIAWGFVASPAPTTSIPNQGIINSSLNAVKVLLLVIIPIFFSSVIYYLTHLQAHLMNNMINPLGDGITPIFVQTVDIHVITIMVIILSLFFGGFAVLQHLFVRLLLANNGHIPKWRYDKFLDYAANDLHILRKVGGSYIFRHRYLLEYFAGRELK